MCVAAASERRPAIRPDDIAKEVRRYAIDEDGSTTLGTMTKPNLTWLHFLRTRGDHLYRLTHELLWHETTP